MRWQGRIGRILREEELCKKMDGGRNYLMSREREGKFRGEEAWWKKLCLHVCFFIFVGDTFQIV